MGKYFKGNIIDVNCLPSYNYYIDIAHILATKHKSFCILNSSSHNLLLYFKKYSSDNLENLFTLISKIISFEASADEKKKLDETLVNILNPTIDSAHGENIIYEKIYDQDGNMYGKELMTNMVFPISVKYSDFEVKYSHLKMDNIYYDLDNKNGYLLDEKYNDGNYDAYLVDAMGNRYSISESECKSLKLLWEMHTEKIFFDHEYHEMAVCETPISFKISLEPSIIFPKNQRIEYVIGGEMLANDLEVEKYLNRFNYGFRKKKHRRNYENKIKNYAYSNFLGENNYTKDSTIIKDRISESIITKEMQELEYILFKLKNVSKEDYEEINQKYLEILNQDYNGLHLNTLSINSIISLQNKAQLSFICHGGDIKKIIDYLSSQINVFINNYNNNSWERTEFSIKELDKLSEFFLSSKNSYTSKEQNEVLRCLALLYFFEIYKNKSVLTYNDLLNSYVADNIKRILVIIDVLYDEGIIKSVPSCLYDINSVEELLEFINKIELNIIGEEKGKQLIKRMQQ